MLLPVLRPAPENSMEALLTSMAVVALAEVGDKTQLLAIVLAMPWSFALQWLHGGPWPGMLVVLAGMAANVGVILWLGRVSRRRL